MSLLGQHYASGPFQLRCMQLKDNKPLHAESREENCDSSRISSSFMLPNIKIKMTTSLPE